MCTRCQDTTKGHYTHFMQREWTTQKCEYWCTTYFVSKAGCDAIHCSSSFTMENFLRHGENNWRLPAITARESLTPSEWGSFASHKELKFYHNRSKWSFGCQCDNMSSFCCVWGRGGQSSCSQFTLNSTRKLVWGKVWTTLIGWRFHKDTTAVKNNELEMSKEYTAWVYSCRVLKH